MGARAIPTESIRFAVEKVLASSLFQNAGRSRALLNFIVDEYVAGRVDRLKEYTIGVEALGRGDSFDPRTDPIVRAEASRLRDRLERYYATEGQADLVAIVLPKGTYVPEFLERSSSPRSPHRSDPAPFARKLVWTAAAALLITSVAATLILKPSFWKRNPQTQIVQFDVELTSRGILGSEVGTDVVLSPDGSRLVFVSRDAKGIAFLNTRALDQPSTAELPGTENARNPFFSADGKWVAFWSDGKLKKTPVEGGSPVTLCDATDLLGGDWGPDGSIIASLGGSKLWHVAAAGGPPSVLLDLTGEQSSPDWPQLLPTGDILFTNIGLAGPNGASIEVFSPMTGKRAVLARGGTFGRYIENGYLTYINQGTLFAVLFDLNRLQAKGAPEPVLEHVAYSPGFGYAQFSVSHTGAVMYRKDVAAELMVESRDQAGDTQTFMRQTGQYLWPRISPDGRRLALTTTDSGVSNISVFDGQTGLSTRLPLPTGFHVPLWTRDGRFLIIGGFSGLAWVKGDATGKPQPLLQNSGTQIPWSVSPDGRRIAFHELDPASGFDLWTVPIQSSPSGLTAGKPEIFLQTPAFETYPSFSPDGNWISYASNESGEWEVYVRQFPDQGQKVRISSNGGRISFWSPNRRELFYRTDDQRIMVATYEIRNGIFQVRSVRPWTDIRLADTGVLANLDLTTDGKRFIYLIPAMTPQNRQNENHATFVSDFFRVINERVH
jgi:serine/threonine-protein kinase